MLLACVYRFNRCWGHAWCSVCRHCAQSVIRAVRCKSASISQRSSSQPKGEFSIPLHVDDTQTDAIAKSKWKALVVVMLGIVMSTLDTTIVNIALPAIGADFGVAINDVSWVAMAYTGTMGILVISYGRMAKHIGYRRIYLWGFSVFVIGSIACALSSGLIMLILARVLQALGGAAVLSIGAAVLALSFPLAQRGRALSAIPVGVAIGISSGPVLGGVLVDQLSWHWIFWVNVPLGLLALICASAWIYPSHSRNSLTDILNLRSILLLALLSACFLMGSYFSQQPGYGWKNPITIFLIVAVPALFVVFLVLDRKGAGTSLVPYSVLKSRVFSFSMIAGALSLVQIGSMMYLISFFMQRIQGFSAQKAGMILLTSPLCLSLSGPISGWISDRKDAGVLRIGGLLSVIAAFALMGSLSDQSPASAVIAYLALFATGMGVFQTPNNHVTVNAIPRSEMAHVNSFIACVRMNGMAVGTSVATVVLSQSLWLSLGSQPPDISELSARVETVSAFQWTFRALAGFSLLPLLCSILAQRGSHGQILDSPVHKI